MAPWVDGHPATSDVSSLKQQCPDAVGGAMANSLATRSAQVAFVVLGGQLGVAAIEEPSSVFGNENP